jgi:gliding motility-associated-like protein
MLLRFLISFIFLIHTQNLISQEYELLGLIDNHILKIDEQTGETSLKIEIKDLPSNTVLRDLVYHEAKNTFYTIANPTDQPYLAKISLSGEFQIQKQFGTEPETFHSIEAISLLNDEIYFSASLNGGVNQNDFYAESLLKINQENDVEFLTEINTEKPFPDIDALHIYEDRIFIFDGAPPNQNFLEFYELEINDLNTSSSPTNIYSSSYIPVADFCFYKNQLFFVAEKGLFTFSNSIQKVIEINSEGLFTGLTQFTACPLPSVNLEEEITVCNVESITLDVEYPNSTYLWSDGSTNSTKTINESGIYEVEITNACGSRSFTTEVSFLNQPSVNLQKKILVCDAKSITLDVEYPNSTYLWSDGSTNSTKTVIESGIYEVEITNACGSQLFETVVTFESSPEGVSIESEASSCSSYILSFTSNRKDIKYLWQGDIKDSFLTVDKTGWYKLQISNACGSKTDSVFIEVKDFSDIVLPNIITPNGDQKNDKFVIDESLQRAAILIYNRYGKLVYQNPRYLNEWGSGNLISGNYFYQITLDCGDIFKGWVEVRK